MSSKFFYHVQGTMFRSKENESDLIEVNEVFKDEDPIISREKAFKHFHSYIEVFLDSKGKQYVSHDETVKDLQDFVNSYKKKHFQLSGNLIDEIGIDVDFDKGLNIFLVVEKSKQENGQTIFEDRFLIHRIDNQLNNLYIEIFVALCKEFELYEKNGFNYKEYRRDYDLSKYSGKVNIKTILESPIDFSTILANRYAKIR